MKGTLLLGSKGWKEASCTVQDLVFTAVGKNNKELLVIDLEQYDFCWPCTNRQHWEKVGKKRAPLSLVLVSSLPKRNPVYLQCQKEEDMTKWMSFMVDLFHATREVRTERVSVDVPLDGTVELEEVAVSPQKSAEETDGQKSEEKEKEKEKEKEEEDTESAPQSASAKAIKPAELAPAKLFPHLLPGGRKRRLVIIGGGMAAATVALSLQHLFDVTMIDKKEYTEYTASILHAWVDAPHSRRIQLYHRQYLHRGTVITGAVTKVDPFAVEVGDLNLTIPYDQLVIASGTRYFHLCGDTASTLTDTVDSSFHTMHQVPTARSILVIGGGFVGVELAGELAYYFPGKKITILEGMDRLLPTGNPKTGAYCTKTLQKMGVHFLMGELFEGSEPHPTDPTMTIYKTKKGTTIEADVAFMCVAKKPNTEFMQEHFADCLEKGYLKVNPYLQLEGYPNIFGLGDCSALENIKLAQNAKNQATYLVKMLKKIMAKPDMAHWKPYPKKPLFLLISIGPKAGCMCKTDGPLCIPGRPMALLKDMVEKETMHGLTKVPSCVRHH